MVPMTPKANGTQSARLHIGVFCSIWFCTFGVDWCI